MKKHPHSPLRDVRGEHFPTVEALEQRGATWEDASDQYLIGFVMESWGTDAANQTSAVMEMQRRLVAATRDSGDCSARQTAEVIKLTNSLKALTWVLVGVGVIQIALMIWKGGA